MDVNVEDKMYHQIEKSLSNNFNDHLFTSGRTNENKYPEHDNAMFDDASLFNTADGSNQDPGMDLPENMSQPVPLSRAEYIRQAREACLRQMSSAHTGSHAVPEYKREDPLPRTDYVLNRSLNLPVSDNNRIEKDINMKELISFRFLIIRMVCAIVIFLAVFIIDRYKVKFGYFTYETIHQFITGNDKLAQLEEFVVSWFK